MSALSDGHANNILEASVAKTAFVASTGPMMLRLMTTTPTSSSNATQVTGGSYSAQSVTFGTAGSQSIANSNAQTYTGMPIATVTAVELWDSAGTPIRKWWGLLSASKTTNLNDTFSVAIGSLTLSFA